MQSNTIILTCLLLLPVVFGNLEKNETTFVPTREWQTVKKGKRTFIYFRSTYILGLLFYATDCSLPKTTSVKFDIAVSSRQYVCSIQAIFLRAVPLSLRKVFM